ncbi:MAG TPA: four helix bundle protein [Caldithrix abyssi]|uniref:Four helix bundle protein n=1 Tax=Caldithrix abyssi TaxID=187145 RepID=A0A7V4U0J8_CALAY|nr:four helix bundle protein [Caldithrix abyssi]
MAPLENLQVYQLAMEIAEDIWAFVINWNYFAQDTLGKQLVRAADSVAANISEGFGRFFYKENRQFCYYSRGSLSEVKTWLTKAHNRRLIDDESFDAFIKKIDTLSVKLNNYIKSIGKNR